MNDLKLQRKGPTTAQQIDSLVNRGAEALSKLTVEQRGELVGGLPTTKDNILAGIGPRLMRVTLPQLTTWITEGQTRTEHPLEAHADAIAGAKERVQDLEISSWLVQPGQAKAEMAHALGVIVADAGVTVEGLDRLIQRLELIADIQAAGHLKTLPRPLVARLNKLSTPVPTELPKGKVDADDGKLSFFSSGLIKLVRVEVQKIAYDSLRKRLDGSQTQA